MEGWIERWEVQRERWMEGNILGVEEKTMIDGEMNVSGGFRCCFHWKTITLFLYTSVGYCIIT